MINEFGVFRVFSLLKIKGHDSSCIVSHFTEMACKPFSDAGVKTSYIQAQIPVCVSTAMIMHVWQDTYVAVRADDGAIGQKQLNNSVCFGRVG